MIRDILRLVKRETRLARQHGHVLLLGRERPGKLPAPVGVEVHFDAPGALDRDEALGLKTARADDGGAGETGRGAEHAIERHGGVGCADGEDDLCDATCQFRTCVGSVRERGRVRAEEGKDDARTTAEVYMNKLRFRWAYSSRAETRRAR